MCVCVHIDRSIDRSIDMWGSSHRLAEPSLCRVPVLRVFRVLSQGRGVQACLHC